uniref:Uncharacterized protein n=1 Tax=Rhizophora mucronata TaxID=61149 RepID=A0A2P2P652_RHIMU
MQNFIIIIKENSNSLNFGFMEPIPLKVSPPKNPSKDRKRSPYLPKVLKFLLSTGQYEKEEVSQLGLVFWIS